MFEGDLARILAAIEIVALKAEIPSDISKLIEGYGAGNIGSHQNVSNFLKNSLKAWSEGRIQIIKTEYAKKIEELLESIKRSYYFTSQKPDIQASKNFLAISIDKTFGPLAPFQNIIRILQSAKISAKSYSSNRVTLGLSNNIRAISAALIGLGFPSIQSFRVAFALQYKFQESGHGDDLIYLPHMEHLKFAYELTGLGMVTSENESAEANLLVIADRQGKHIYVKSMSALISNFAKGKNSNKIIRINTSDSQKTNKGKSVVDLSKFWEVSYNFKMS